MLVDIRTASTHILKVGVTRFPAADIAEFVSMRAAHHLGLPVAPVALEHLDGQTALVVGRYDRLITDGGTRRFHQEDLCQVFAVSRRNKYQGDRGPGPGVIAELIAGLDPRDQRASRDLFARAQVYNWLTAGIDAHAKNYSLLVAGDRARLAPLYDVTSGVLLLDPERVFYKGKLAMKVGGEYRLRNIGAHNILHAADDLGVDREWLLEVGRDYLERIPDAFAAAVEDAMTSGGELVDPAIRARYLDRGIVAFTRLVERSWRDDRGQPSARSPGQSSVEAQSAGLVGRGDPFEI